MTNQHDAGREDPRIQRTFDALKTAFAKEIAQKPFAQISVQELCDTAMVRRTTFYRHFHDKQEFLQWYMQEMHREFNRCFEEEEIPDSVAGYFAQLCRRVLFFLNRHEEGVKLLVQSGPRGNRMLGNFLRSFLDEIALRLRGWKEFQDGQNGAAIPFLAEFYVGGMLAALQWWYGNNKPCAEEELIHYLRKTVERNEAAK